jgi:hypothetical protein
MGVFGGGDIGCQNGHRHKNQQQGKSDNGSRIPENSIQCKFKFPQPRMGVGHRQLGAFFAYSGCQKNVPLFKRFILQPLIPAGMFL